MFLRRAVVLGVLGAASALSSSPFASSGLPVQRLRGGGDFRVIKTGIPMDEDRSEPFMHHVKNPEPSEAQYANSDEDATLYDPDWSAARVDIEGIIRRREASAAAAAKEAAPAAAVGGMVPVTIKISAHHIHPINSPPVKIVICGSTPELGNWDVTKAVELKSFASDTDSFTNDAMFPLHSGTIQMPAGKEVTYKFAVTKVTPGDGGIQTQWESVERKLMVPASGTMELRNEFMEGRDTDPRITDEPFQCNAQEWCRYYKHHVSGLQEVQPGREG